jgi:hypothetical protein
MLTENATKHSSKCRQKEENELKNRSERMRRGTETTSYDLVNWTEV